MLQQTEKGLVQRWRADRRHRLIGSLDWTRNFLFVMFVDGNGPYYSRARLSRFFFDRVITSGNLYSYAGGLHPTLQDDADDLSMMGAVPGLSYKDMQSLSVAPFQFDPKDIDTYDVMVAMDEDTSNEIQLRLRQAGRPDDPDNLCVIGDFIDAYESVLSMQQGEGGQDTGVESVGYGMGPQLPFLPQGWEDSLWPAGKPGRKYSELSGWTWTPKATLRRARTRRWTQRMVGRLLRSVVGLQRTLVASKNLAPSNFL